MAIDTTYTAEEDLQTVTDAVLAGRPIPEDVRRRVEERANAVRERIKRDGGTEAGFSVTLIREARESSR